jgi:nucleotide-binding universal stress UspA family protein
VFNTIIVGVDGAEGGRDALLLADGLRSVFGGELVAVHAYASDLFVSREVTPDFESTLHAHATELVEVELDRTGVKAQAVALADGSPGRALHAAARWHASGLIVVGSDRRGPLGRVLAGDVTAATLHGAVCPVIVAPRGYDRDSGIGAIGVGYDGSPEARAAARFARDLAVAAGASLRVLRVLRPPSAHDTAIGFGRDWQESPDAVREHAQEDLDDLLAELGEVARGDVIVGEPVRELSYEAGTLDLLVAGSRDYGPVRRVMPGSTSGKLVHHAPCPVLVLTRAAAHELPEVPASDAASTA